MRKTLTQIWSEYPSVKFAAFSVFVFPVLLAAAVLVFFAALMPVLVGIDKAEGERRAEQIEDATGVEVSPELANKVQLTIEVPPEK
jgi:hypothetical protein